jgi:nucleotide-binding universal stress UspA family protein
MFRTVLMPMDFSEDNALVRAFARGLPTVGVRRVVLAHVVNAHDAEGRTPGARVDEIRERMQPYADELAETGLGVEVRVSVGDPVEALSALAAEGHVDAAVYGSHAKSLTAQLVTGSISERFFRDASIPHLVVRFDLLRGQSDPSSLLRRFGEKLVMPTDFSLSASRAFARMLDLPAGVVKHAFLLHAVDPGLTGEKQRRAEEGAEFHLKNLQAMCAQQKVSASVSIRQEPAIQAILRELDDRRATGVIVGTRGRNAVQEMLLGSVSMTLLHQASCPVMIVP